MSIVLNISHKKLLSVIYYTRYMVVSLEKEKREEVKERAEQLREADFKTLNDQMEEELKETEKDFEKEIKELGKDAKSQFSKSQIDHKKKQALAKIKRDYAERKRFLMVQYKVASVNC
jgi:tRNA C32,U32 (ribose-2'-O)-methylase TrmJ